MTAMRSHMLATTPRSWVIMMMLIPIFWRSSCISSRIWAWMVTSRAVVGSSAMSSLGSQARAMAIITRWRIPPESSWGYCFSRLSGSLMPTSSSSSLALALASPLDLSVWRRITSSIWLPMVYTGFRLVMGSWKMMETSFPRILRNSFSLIRSTWWPLKRMVPPMSLPG